jgi:hypothetical protein
MTHPRSATSTVVAILGADTVVENALARLQEGEGYATRILKTFPMGETLVEEEMPVGGVDLVVLAPSLSTSECGHDEPMLVCNRGNSKAVFYVAFIIPTSTTEEGLRIDDPQPKECNVR